MRTTLVLLLALASHAAAQAPGKHPYAGRWSLDVAASRDLPPFYAMVRSHTLEIAQDDTSLVVGVVMTDTAGVAMPMRFPYDLRKPVRTTTQVRTPSGPREIPTTLTATPRADGGIDVDIAREVAMGGTVAKPMDRERWALSADGRQLLIDREAEMPGPGGMRTIRARYVFVRG